VKTQLFVPVAQRKFRVLNQEYEPVLERDITLAHTLFRFVAMIANFYDRTEAPVMPEDMMVGEKSYIHLEVANMNGIYILLRTK